MARIGRHLDALPMPAPPGGPATERTRPERYYAVLLGVYEYGRRGIGREAFADLGAVHDYDPRGLGGFFVGGRGALRRDGDLVRLTHEGQRLLDSWLAGLR